MLDLRLLRNNLADVVVSLATRGYQFEQTTFLKLEAERKALQIETENLQSERNKRAKLIGQTKVQGHSISKLVTEADDLSISLMEAQTKLDAIQEQIANLLLQFPNLPHESVPLGNSEKDNVSIRTWGKPNDFNFPAKDHLTLAKQWIDPETAVKIARSRFAILYGPLALLQRALIQFMLQVHVTEHGYREVYVPYLVNAASLYGTGQLPKMAEDLFRVDFDPELYLIPTAEVPVTNIVRDRIVEKLPLKFVCHTPCFRSEAGSYGKDTHGLIRVHQFEKVEIVQMVEPDLSYATLEILVQHAEAILQKLGLPYRVMSLCTADLGFASAKTYDLEVWLPSQQCYREISSCSNFEAFQARRMQARWRNPKTGKPELVHTLNGSGLAVGRTLVAILENYQDEKGRIHIPEVLWEYTRGLKLIDPTA